MILNLIKNWNAEAKVIREDFQTKNQQIQTLGFVDRADSNRIPSFHDPYNFNPEGPLLCLDLVEHPTEVTTIQTTVIRERMNGTRWARLIGSWEHGLIELGLLISWAFI